MPDNSKFTKKPDSSEAPIKEETLSEIFKESLDRVVKDFRAMTAVLGHKAFDRRYGEGAYEAHKQEKRNSAKALHAYNEEVDRRLWNRLVESQNPNKSGLDGVRKAAPLMMMLGGPIAAVGTGLAMGSSPETTPYGKTLPPGFKYTRRVERLRNSIAAEVAMDEKLGRISFKSGVLRVLKPDELEAENRVVSPRSSSAARPSKRGPGASKPKR